MKKKSLRDTVLNRVNFNTANAASMSEEAFLELHKDEWPDASDEERSTNLKQVHQIAVAAVKEAHHDGSGTEKAPAAGKSIAGSGKDSGKESGSAGGLQSPAAKEGKG